MEPVRVGLVIRALRRRRRWRQIDLANAAGVSQSTVSLVERGHMERLALRTLRDVGGALDAAVSLDVRWRGGELDRLLDAQHATVVARLVAVLTRLGWTCEVEVSYAEYGERGSVDVLGWHAMTRILLVAEVKTELVSLEGTLRKLDEKVRLGRVVAARRLEWHARGVSRILVLPESMTLRRRIAEHETLLKAALPTRGAAVRSWLREPDGAMRGLCLLSVTNRGGGRGASLGRGRVRLGGEALARAQRESGARAARRADRRNRL